MKAELIACAVILILFAAAVTGLVAQENWRDAFPEPTGSDKPGHCGDCSAPKAPAGRTRIHPRHPQSFTEAVKPSPVLARAAALMPPDDASERLQAEEAEEALS